MSCLAPSKLLVGQQVGIADRLRTQPLGAKRGELHVAPNVPSREDEVLAISQRSKILSASRRVKNGQSLEELPATRQVVKFPRCISDYGHSDTAAIFGKQLKWRATYGSLAHEQHGGNDPTSDVRRRRRWLFPIARLLKPDPRNNHILSARSSVRVGLPEV